MSRSLAALLSVILTLSVCLHAAPGHAKDLPTGIQILVESGDHGLMVLPRETLEQRSREDDGSAGGLPDSSVADLKIAVHASTAFTILSPPRHIAPGPADPAANPAAPRAPPFPLPL